MSYYDVSTLGIEVRSDSVVEAQRRLDGLQKSSGQAETATGNLSSTFTQLSGAIKVVAGALGTFKLAQYAYEAATLSARYTTLGVVLHRVGQNVGYTTQQMDQYAKGLREAGISAIESRSTLTRLTQAHIDLSKATDLAREAQDAAVIGNINSSEAFERMVFGIQSAQTEVLRGIGLNVNFEASYKRLAEEIGTTTAALTEEQKMQARVSEVMAAGQAITGVYSDAMETAGKKMTSLARYAEDAKVEVGKLFEPALASSIDMATTALKGFTAGMESLNKAIEKTKRQDFTDSPWMYELYPTMAAGANEAASALEHLARAGDMVERSLATQAAKAKAEHVDLFGLEETAARAGDIVSTIKDIISDYQYERGDTATETATKLVQTEQDAADSVVDIWKSAFADIAALMGQRAGTATAQAASSPGFGNQVGLAGSVIRIAQPNYTMRMVGRVNGTAYYSQDTYAAAAGAAQAEYERQLSAYEQAVREAEALQRQWEGVLSSYESLLTSIEDYRPSMSFAQLSANLDQATASVGAAKDFLRDLTYYAGELQGYKSGFESLGERIQSEITSRDRAGWGASDYASLYASLSAQYAGLDTGAADYYDSSLDLSEQMLDALLSIEDAQGAALAATEGLRTSLSGVFGTLDTTIAGLYGSNLAPSQSLEFYTSRYSALYNRASSSLASEDVGALSAFVTQNYLPFLQGYGGDYQSVFDSVIQDLEAIQDATGFSILGTFTTLQGAMEETGAFAEWLSERLGEDLTGALSSVGASTAGTESSLSLLSGSFEGVTAELSTLATNTSTSLSGVTTALNSLVTTLEAAIASIGSSTGTTINISSPTPTAPVVPQYDYAWVFRLQDSYPDYSSGGAWYYRGTWSTPHGGSVTDYMSQYGGYVNGAPSYGVAYAEGGIATEPTRAMFGERYTEAAVPLTERHLEPFMRAAGYGKEDVAGQIEGAVERGFRKVFGPMAREITKGGRTGNITIMVDGRVLGNVIASELETGNTNLVRNVRRISTR